MPKIYPKEIEDKICEAIASCASGLERICEKNKDFPSAFTIRKWIVDPRKKEFIEKYKTAKEIQADLICDEIVDIIDDVDPKNRTAIEKARWQIDSRKWVAGRLKPKVYADKVFTGAVNKEGETVDERPTLDYSKLNMNELKLLRMLEKKAAIK